MKASFDRRKLLQASLILSAQPLQAAGFLDWLMSPEASKRIHAILQEHFQVGAESLALMPEFIKRLRTKGLHSEKPEQFNTWLQPGHETELAAYVLEEFLIASNYFAVQAGEESRLRMRRDELS